MAGSGECTCGLAAAATERGEEGRGGDELRTERIAAKEGAELELQYRKGAKLQLRWAGREEGGGRRVGR